MTEETNNRPASRGGVPKNRLAYTLGKAFGRQSTSIVALIAIAALSLVSMYFGISLCPVYSLIGIPCPSCGMTRAWVAALRGDFHAAFFLHPLFWAVALLAGFIGLSALPQTARPLAKWTKLANGVGIGLLVLLLVVWVCRMVLLFPHTPPMTVNEQAVMLKIWKGLR